MVLNSETSEGHIAVQKIVGACVFCRFSHLHPVSDLYKCTGGVESPSSTGIQVRAVIVVHNLHIIHTVGLKHRKT